MKMPDTMNKKHITLIAVALAFCSSLLAQPKANDPTVRQVFVPKAGTLVEQFTEEEANQITHLTLTGKINAIDFRHLRDEFKSLQVLDLSNVSISSYAGKNGTYPERFYVYPANYVPAYAFCRQLPEQPAQGKETLQHVILSEKIHNIEDAAFKGCRNLRICEIHRKKSPNLLKQALADSITAIFIPLGCTDEYRMDKRWETFAIIEGTPLTATAQLTQMESLASALTRQGIQPKEVNFLRIEGNLSEEDFQLIRDYMPNLVSIDLQQTNATSIPDYTFTQKRYLLNIRLPQALKRIGQRAFSGCTRLCGTLELPATVTALEYGAFMGCTNLRRVVATGREITTLGDNLFGNEENKLVYLPDTTGK